MSGWSARGTGPGATRCWMRSSRQLPGASVRGVAAGLHLLVTLPDANGSTTSALADELRDAGVLVHPLSWHSQRPGPPGLVIGYAAHTPDRLREAAAIIGRVAQRRNSSRKGASVYERR